MSSAGTNSSSSKKKKLWTDCGVCNCIFLSRDFERHRTSCSGSSHSACPSPSSAIPHILRSTRLCGLAQCLTVAERDRLLPGDCTGWSRQHTVFVNPETLAQLAITARRPCLLRVAAAGVDGDCSSTGNGVVVVVWPSDTISNLRVLCGSLVDGVVPDSLILLEPVPAGDLEPASRIVLRPLPCPSDDDREGRRRPTSSTSCDELREFTSAYLSGAYLNIGAPIRLRYFGRYLRFAVIAGDEEGECLHADLARLAIGEKVATSPSQSRSRVLQLGSNPRVTIAPLHAPSALDDSDSAARSRLTPGTVTFADIGGLAKVKGEIEQFIIGPLKKGSFGCALLLWGMTGCGKSLLLDAIANAVSASGRGVTRCDPRRAIEAQFDAMQSNPVDLLLIDDLDHLLRADGADSHLAYRLRALMDYGDVKALIAVVRSIDDVDLALRRRFAIELELIAPDEGERGEILEILIARHRELGAISKQAIVEMAKRTHGFTGSDLACLCDLTRVSIASNADKSVDAHFESARLRVRPTGIRQFLLEVPNVQWTDIGGYAQLKREIQQAVIWPLSHPDAFTRLGITPPSGILLYGPPGCSKTLIARALASQSRLNFLSVKGPELFNKWVGESERAVRELFRRARQVAPTILFFDEIDAVGSARGTLTTGNSGGGSAVGERVLAQLLTELDGLEKRARVLVLAATNRPEVLDAALLRPGRLDRMVYVPLPDEETREAILDLNLARMPLGKDVDTKWLISKTAGYSGAELVAVCRSAAMAAMLDDLATTSVDRGHFERAVNAIPPRTANETVARYEMFAIGANRS